MPLTLDQAQSLIEFDLYRLNDVENTNENIIEELQKRFHEILVKACIDIQDVDLAYLIGSYSRGTQISPYSDVDILIFSDSLDHREDMFLWDNHLISLYVYTFSELIAGLNGVDAPHWVQSLQEAKSLHETDDRHQQVTEEIGKADLSLKLDKSVPLIALRRVLEYRRKLLALKSANKSDEMLVSYLGGQFVINYILMKCHLSGTTIETETQIFSCMALEDAPLRNALHSCQISGSMDDVLAAMNTLLNDLLDSISKLHDRHTS